MSYVQAVDFVVTDLSKAVKFFREVLEFTELETREEKSSFFAQLYHHPEVHAKRTRMKLGNAEIYLTEMLNPKGKPFPPDSISSDLWFQHIAIVVSDMEKAYKKLSQHHAYAISHSPQTIPEWNKPAAGIKAFYFRSPDHHPLEIIFYPPGKGCAEWQEHRGRLFLGIDHTAIAVSDTEKSLKFYQDILGLQVMGESLNYGETQERLTSIPGAKVRITGLRDKQEKGIGLEFLHYIGGKRGRLSKHAPHDLTATKTIIKTPNLEPILKKLGKEHMRGKIEEKGKTVAALLVDPDGHYVLLI